MELTTLRDAYNLLRSELAYERSITRDVTEDERRVLGTARHAARRDGRLSLAADLLAAMPWWLRLVMPERVRRLLEEMPENATAAPKDGRHAEQEKSP